MLKKPTPVKLCSLDTTLRNLVSVRVQMTTRKMNALEPFGKYLEPAYTAEAGSVESWNWKPVVWARLDLLSISGSIPGTTGTGPTAREDERREET
jgi:hypothetical protein